MKRFLLFTFSLAMLNSAFAYNVGDLKKFIATGQCPRGDLSGANLSNFKLKQNWLQKIGLKIGLIETQRINLIGANLKNTDFSGCKELKNAMVMDADLEDANFENTNCGGSLFCRSKLLRTNFKDANLNKANFHHVEAPWANFHRASMDSIHMAGANLNNANMSHVKAFHPNMIEANMNYINLNNAWLIKAYMQRARMNKAKMRDANLAGANMHEADLEHADMDRSNMRNADIRKANVWGTNMERADLHGASFTKPFFFYHANLYHAKLGFKHEVTKLQWPAAPFMGIIQAIRSLKK